MSVFSSFKLMGCSIINYKGFLKLYGGLFFLEREDLIDLEVISESKPEATKAIANTNSVFSLAFSAVLVASFLLLDGQSAAIPTLESNNQVYDYRYIYNPNNIAYYAKITNSDARDSRVTRKNDSYIAKRMMAKEDVLSKKIKQMEEVLGQRNALNKVRHHAYSDSKIADPMLSKELLESAGYSVPDSLEDYEKKVAALNKQEQVSKTDKPKDKNRPSSTEFVKSVVGEVVKDEVSSFFTKMRIAADVGSYIIDSIDEDE